MCEIKLVIFDLDGTIVDAFAAIVKSVNFTLRACGYKILPARKILPSVGWGDRPLIASFVKKPDIDRALVIYRTSHAVTLKKYSRLLPYAKVTLRYLIECGLKLAIASNRPTKFTKLILKKFGIFRYFDYVLCADKLIKGKPHPEIILKILKALNIKKPQAVYVGDMAIDVIAANRAGIKSIIVRSALSASQEIRKAKPFRIIRNLKGLGKIISFVNIC